MFLSRLFKIEKIAGAAILIVCGAYQVFRLFGLAPALPGIYGLLPLLILFSGATLLLAGAGSERYPAYPALLHVPLVIWLVIFVLALQ